MTSQIFEFQHHRQRLLQEIISPPRGRLARESLKVSQREI